jgi:hypothetical protein
MFSLIKRLFLRDRKDRQTGRRPPIRTVNGGSEPPLFPNGKRSPAAEILDNPDLSVETQKDSGFDPYNTGTFNRSGSWERINKRRNS